LFYWLLYEKLFPFFHPFRVFRYLTLRTAFASLTALLIALFIGPWVIKKLREFQIGHSAAHCTLVRSRQPFRLDRRLFHTGFWGNWFR